jgi:hypothetical protein
MDLTTVVRHLVPRRGEFSQDETFEIAALPPDVASEVTEIRVPTMDDQCLRADRQVLVDLFGDDLRADVPPATFSAQDLWFVTV